MANRIAKISFSITFVFSLIAANVYSVGEKTTTIFIVRHAEKAKEPKNNPDLTPMGETRAETLAMMLQSSGVSAVFSTNTKRTIETVNNYADMKNLKVQIYKKTDEIVNLVRSQYAGQKVLISGHSNTVPDLVRTFGVDVKISIEDDEYDNLFIVTLAPDGCASLVRLRF